MACPLCGEHCRCAEPRAFVSAPEFIDPDAPDDSEAQFAASLETFAAPQPRYNRIIMPQPTPPSEPQFASAVQDQFALAPQPELPASADADRWREEVANRLHNYRAKRRRRAGQNSMELDFEPPAPPPPAATYEAAALAPAAEEAPPVAEPEPQTVVRWDGTVDAPEPRLPDVWNVIPFPAPEPDFPRADELAEPVLTTPRILDVPEMVEQALPTPLSEISLEPEEAQALDDIEIPLQVAPLPQRLFGGVVDLVIVLAATTMFGLIAWKITGGIHFSKSALALGLAIPCTLWIVYQYLFLVYGARTLGMQMAQVGLCGFEGEAVDCRTRRWRALSLALSSVSLGLGFIWALVDEDTLCWHDRITRTYPVEVAQQTYQV